MDAEVDAEVDLLHGRLVAFLPLDGIRLSMLDQEGQPMPELFTVDGLHMNAAGYQLWTSIIQPRLATDLGF